MWLYEGHLGSLYTSDEPIDYEDLYCEQCGDSDREIGNFDSAIDVLKYMADDIDANDCFGGWSIEYVLKILYCFDDVPSLDDAIKIVKENRTVSDKY